MSTSKRDVRLDLTSTWQGAGIDLAVRDVTRAEQTYRRQVQMQERAGEEMAAAEAKKAAAIEQANTRQRAAMESTGTALLGLSAAAVVGIGLTVRAASDWESAWAGVNKTVDGSPAQMAALEESLRGLARTLPATHEEIAAVAEAAGQLGIKREDVAGFTRVMIDLSETTNLTADQAATKLAQFMNIMGTSADSVDRLGSTLVALGNDGASTEADIVEMAQRMAGAGKLVGATEGEVLGLASALSSMGVTAELGGGVATRVLMDLYATVATGGDKLDQFAQVAGTTATKFAEQFRADPVAALATFAEGLNGVEGSGGNVVQTLRELGFTSSEEQRILLQLKANSDLVTDSLDLQAEAWDANNALQIEAATRYETTESKLAVARNSINNAAIDVGGVLLPALAEGAEKVANLANMFSDLPAPVQNAITIIGTVTTGITLAGGAALIAIPKMRAFQTTLTDLGGGSSRLGKAVGGAAGILAGPWGLALGAGVAALGVWASKQADAEAHVRDLTDSLDAQTGAWTGSSREIMFSALDTAGAIDQARNAGLDLNDVVDAALNPTSQAFQRIATDAKAAEDAFYGMNDGDEGYSDALDKYEAYRQVLKALGGEHEDVAEAQQGLADRQAAGVLTTEEAGAAQEKAAGQYDKATAAITSQTEELGEHLELLREAAGIVLDQRTAERQFEDSLQGARDSLQDFRDGVIETEIANGASEAQAAATAQALLEQGAALDITTEAGRNNQDALDKITDSGWDLIDSLATSGATVDELQASMTRTRDEFIKTATDMGMPKEAAEALADSLELIPEKITTIAEFQSAVAEQQLADFKAKYNGKTIAEVGVTVYENLVSAGVSKGQAASGARYSAMAAASANGNIFEFYAEGGLRENHVAQISAGTTRIWAEPETGGEAYIPFAPEKRGKATEIWQESGRRLGVYENRQYGTYADNPTASVIAALAASGPASARIHPGDLRDLALEIGHTVNRKSMGTSGAALNLAIEQAEQALAGMRVRRS